MWSASAYSARTARFSDAITDRGMISTAVICSFGCLLNLPAERWFGDQSVISSTVKRECRRGWRSTLPEETLQVGQRIPERPEDVGA
jgi:hypothetical protein